MASPLYRLPSSLSCFRSLAALWSNLCGWPFVSTNDRRRLISSARDSADRPKIAPAVSTASVAATPIQAPTRSLVVGPSSMRPGGGGVACGTAAAGGAGSVDSGGGGGVGVAGGGGAVSVVVGAVEGAVVGGGVVVAVGGGSLIGGGAVGAVGCGVAGGGLGGGGVGAVVVAVDGGLSPGADWLARR